MSVYRLELSGRDKPVFTSPVDEVCFSKAEEDNEYARQAKATDLAFFLRRQDPEINLRGLQSVLVSSEEREQTAVGYLPIILAPAHEFDTLNTVVNICMAISSRFGQKHTVITVDQALYYRPMELKWSLPQYQDKLIPRLGGLHVSMNFLKAIGDHMNGSGVADVWWKMELLGPDAVELVLAGNAYNRAMRALKLILQALWRLLMPSLLSIVAEADANCHACVSRIAADDDSQTIPELITFLDRDKFRKLLAGFVDSRSDVVNFSF